MDVRLPNGTVIRNVPEGMSRFGIADKAIANGLAKPEDFGLEGGPSAAAEGGVENFRAGIGSGLVNTARQVTNMVLPKALEPKWATDEAIGEQGNLDEDLLATGSGLAGKVVGEIAATMPIGGVAGRGVAATARLARPASTAGKYLVNTLARGAGRGAVEGATVGSVLAGPGERVSGGAMMGAAGGVMGAAGTALGKTLGKGHVVDKLDEALELEALTGVSIPLSQSAKPGIIRQIYNAFIANYAGAGGKLRTQFDDTEDDLRRFIGEHLHHPKGDITITAADDIPTMMGKLDDYWKTAFDGIKNLPIVVSSKGGSVVPKVPVGVARALKSQIDDGLVVLPADGMRMTGRQLTDLRATLKQLWPNTMVEQRIFQQYDDALKKLMRDNWNPTGKSQGAAAMALRQYEETLELYPHWMNVKNAVMVSPSKTFNPSVAGKSAPLSGPVPDAPRAGMLATKAMQDFPSRQGLFQSLAATAPVAGAGYRKSQLSPGGVTGSVMAYLGGLGIARAALSPAFQRYLAGQTAGQALGKSMMAKFSRELKALGMGARDIAIVLGGQDG